MASKKRPYRVVVWGTGAIGKYNIQRTLEMPDLELAGAFVYSNAKDGRDIGEIAGCKPVGVKATKDKKAILKMDADIVLYTPLTIDLDDICAILESGKNLITPSGFVYLKDQSLINRFNAACARGSSTMYAAGIHPGFMGDRLVLTLSALCRHIEKITVYELVNMADMTESSDLIFGHLGFNMDPERAAKTKPPLLDTMSRIFFESQQMVAAGLGLIIESHRTLHEYAFTTEDSPTTPGMIKKGHVGAQRFSYQSLVGERVIIDFKSVWRMAERLDRTWDNLVDGEAYIVDIAGDPGLKCVVEPIGERPAEIGLIFTAMLVMNAIPEICEAQPGFRTTLDLPLIAAKHAFTL